MIDFAKAKLPTADLFVADMVDFEVKDPVHAVVCLFGGIGYVFPKERLNSTARAFADAVKPGGALIVEPWLTEELFVEGRITMQTYDTEGLKICRSVVAKKDGAFSTFRFHWLAAEAGAEDVEYFIDDHRLWLCPHETLLGAFDRAGFDVRFDPDGLMPDRGLVVGTRRR